jgi:hypothetical protein
LDFGCGHDLYSSAKNYLLTSGTTSLCANNFCKSNVIKTITGTNAGRVQYIGNKFNLTLKDLKTFSDKTQSSFKDGTR